MTITRQAIKTRIATKIPSTKVFGLQHCPKASVTILHRNTRRAATHIAYIRLDTLLGVARGRKHGLFALKFIERRLFNKRYQLANHKAQRCKISRTETRFVFTSISKGEKGYQKRSYEGDRRDARSVTRCHHVAFSGSFAPQLIFAPYASRVLYSYENVGPDLVCPSKFGNEFTSLHHLYRIRVIPKYSTLEPVSMQRTYEHRGCQMSVKDVSQKKRASPE
jgi:hypothetical protein